MQASERFWNDIAESYARKPVDDEAAYQAKLKATKARLSPQDVVLDLGCGTGSLALELSPRVAQVHSVDWSSAMIRICERKVEEAGASNVTFHKNSVDALPDFEPGSFGMVCAYNILHLVDDLDGLLREVMQLLRPGGHFISTTVCLGESRVPYGAVIALMRLWGKAPKVYRISVAGLMQSMESAGFVEIERQAVSADEKIAFLLARKQA